MIDPVPAARPKLFTNGDAEAWKEQFHFLFYVLGMDAQRIAQIDYGFDPDHPEAWLAYPWEQEIERTFPVVNVGPMIEAVR